MSSTQEQQQPPQKAPRKPAYQDWPTIKILTVPKGKYSRQSDEWCATFCTQSVTGRFHHQDPSCRSICIRKVFPHEVRNIISFKRHTNVGPDGKAKYPLPAEGQPQNVPRILGGNPGGSDDDDASHHAQEPTKHWDEGWYLWTSSNSKAAVEKMVRMSEDLPAAQRHERAKARRTQVWHDYVEYVEQRSSSKAVDQKDKDNRWYGDITPPRPSPDVASDSLLIPFPPEFPLWEQMNRLLDPSRHALGLLHSAITTGDMQRFAGRAWEKACSAEPWILASRACSRSWDVIRGKEEDDDNKRGPR